jgi:hypothetical protein
MRNRQIIFLLFLLCATALQAQSTGWRLKGHVLDETGMPVSGATIVAGESARTRTDTAGQFDLTLPSKSGTISIRCIGYFSQRIRLDIIRFDGHVAQLRIALLSNSTALPEVSVSGKAVVPIFEEDLQTSLIDYAFAGKDLVMLVREKKRYYLRLTDDNGRKLSEVRLPDPVRHLHKSCTGDFHAVGDYWVWEAALVGRQIDTFARYPAAQFHKLVEPCVTEQDGNYFFRQSGPFRQSVAYFYFDPGYKRHPLVVIRDEINEQQLLRRYREILFSYMKTIPDIDRDDILDHKSPMADAMKATNTEMMTKMAVTNELLAEIGFFNQLAEDSVCAPMLKIGKKVYIFDHINDRLLSYATSPWSTTTAGLTYHHASNWRKEVLADQVLNRLYGLFNGSGGVLVLKEIDPDNGTAQKSYSLTELPHLAENYKIRNGTLYCLVQPDVTEPIHKLLKMNIFKFVNQ